jgi:hypothetical protein
MMLYMHIYYCALRGLRAARFGELRPIQLDFNRCLSAGTPGHVLSPLHDHIIERFSITPHLSGILKLIALALS